MKNCFLLETLADTYQPQTTGQSYIGIAPSRVFTARSNEFFVDGTEHPTDNAYRQLERELPREINLPAGYVGGLVGFFLTRGYQLLRAELAV